MHFQQVTMNYSLRRAHIAITENYIRSQNIKTVPGDRTYATVTKYGKKTSIVGDSPIKRSETISAITRKQLKMST